MPEWAWIAGYVVGWALCYHCLMWVLWDQKYGWEAHSPGAVAVSVIWPIVLPGVALGVVWRKHGEWLHARKLKALQAEQQRRQLVAELEKELRG